MTVRVCTIVVEELCSARAVMDRTPENIDTELLIAAKVSREIDPAIFDIA